MLRLLWPLLYMGMLYFLSSIPGTPIPENGSGFLTLAWLPATAQNFLHFPAYGLLAWLWFAKVDSPAPVSFTPDFMRTGALIS